MAPLSTISMDTNEGPSPSLVSGEDVYSYELYEVETRRVRAGQVTHYRPDGINPLIVKILNDASQQKLLNREKS